MISHIGLLRGELGNFNIIIVNSLLQTTVHKHVKKYIYIYRIQSKKKEKAEATPDKKL